MTSALSITSPLQGTIWQLKVAAGDEVRQGQELIIIESMKMEHPIKVPESGVISVVLIDEAATVVPVRCHRHLQCLKPHSSRGQHGTSTPPPPPIRPPPVPVPVPVPVPAPQVEPQPEPEPGAEPES